MGFFFRKKNKADTPPALLRGTVTVGNRVWHVTEERRQGPRPQVFVLRADDNVQVQMQVRPLPGHPLGSIEDVQQHAEDPELRWFHDEGGLWEARLVVSDNSIARRIKFISWTLGVFEGDLPGGTNLGLMSDEQLLDTLKRLRNHHGPE